LRSSFRDHDPALPTVNGWFIDAKMTRELRFIEIHKEAQASYQCRPGHRSAHHSQTSS
jgi:hypothetical protein